MMGAGGCQRQLSPPGTRWGLLRLRLTLRGVGSLWSWQLAGFISASSHSSLLSFPLFPFAGSTVSARSPVTLGAHLPPLQQGKGKKGAGTAFCETPLCFFDCFPSQPVCPWLAEPVPPSPSLSGSGRSLGVPPAPPELANRVLWLFVVARSRCHARGQCRWHRTILLPGDAGSESQAWGSLLRSRHGAAPGPLPHTQRPQPKAEGEGLQVK